MKCHNCSQDNPADARFCQNCGQPLEKVCPNCGTSNVTDAKFCKQCGSLLATEGDRLGVLQQAAPQALQDKIRAASTNIEGERKPVTILFTDIVGSTSLAEKLDPEEWKEIVSGAHQRVSQAVYRYEGTIAQLLGDGVLAFFGAPVTHEDDPVRAVHAALEIQDAIAAYARELQGYVDDFQMRVGINTGMVVVGNVGSDMHMEYLAIGDAVNLAARLQSAARPGCVLISEATEKLVKAAFRLNALGEIKVKGKAEPIEVFEVLEPKVAPASGRGIEGFVSPFVGREQDLSTLNAALNKLSAGHGQIVAVLGEAGIGKSRLVEEVRHLSERQPNALYWLEGRALSYGQNLSFWTISQLILTDLGLSDGDPEAKIKVTLRKRVKALCDDRSANLLPYLARLMGVNLDDESAERMRQLDGETLKRQTLWAIAEYFNCVAQKQPTVLIFEDLHWADPSTLDALEKLLALTDRSPLMLLLLARTERDHSFWQIKFKAETDYAYRYAEIYLKALSAEDSNRLVNQLLEVADLPERIRLLILDRSEGNPFYLEEIIRSLIEQAVIVHEGSTWRATAEISNVEIPETLQGVLLARIDRLQEDVRRTLQLASVIGKSFLYRLLEAIASAERQLDEHLSQLQRADLVREKTRRPELEYIFKHSLTQQAAYNSLLIERRKEFHRKVGEALEGLFADRPEEFYGLLAHHFDAAGEQDKAIDYFIKAGDKSRLEDAHQEAIQYYQRAIDLLDEIGDLQRAIKTWLKLGLIHQINFEFERAHQANETAFALERQLRGRDTRLRSERSGQAQPYTFRTCFKSFILATLDPSKTNYTEEAILADGLFAGLAEFDSETNIVPHVARSWEVLDSGTRYVFHLRDDVRWTDGTSVTAQDFEWTWKHNLTPGQGSTYVRLFDDILGARDYREGRNPDPDSIGVRALDLLTLEVQLINPVAHFIYLVAQPITYPLPRAVVERYGDQWWKPEHIVSNGAFRLLEFEPAHGLMARNPDYFGEFPGNLDRFEWRFLENDESEIHEYQAGHSDYCVVINASNIPIEVSPGERFIRSQVLSTAALILIPTQPPLDDVRIRRALVYGFDRQKWLELYRGDSRARWLQGGVVPPGMAGHSPELGLAFDLERARQLLADAGYPGGKRFPQLKLATIPFLETRHELERQFLDNLGIQVELTEIPPNLPFWEVQEGTHMLTAAWLADYPDPESFLRQSAFYLTPRNKGWHHSRYEQLIEEAVRTADRARRLAMYREADRILVNDEVVVVPATYSDAQTELIKPWVKVFKENALGQGSLKDIVIESH
jgi:ABC-type oligopeptide transport system substrate-binding subunit/class 3 adenylate cyclase